MKTIPYIPESAPFSPEQRAWLNGFLAGLLAGGAAVEPRVAQPDSPAAEPLLILFGSQTGTAEALAARIAKQARQQGFAPSVASLNDYEQAGFIRAARTVIVSSTWGDGDPPDNAANFWSWLSSETAPRLEGLQFAVLGLGDRNYADFCGASKKFDARLEALGAHRLLPRGECDLDYEVTARTWLDALWTKVAKRTGLVPSISIDEPQATSQGGFSRSNPFPGRLLKNVLLNKPGSSKEVWDHEISLHGSGLGYDVGDALGVLPVNCPSLASELLATLRCNGDELVRVGEAQMPLGDALLRELDITRPSRALLDAVAQRVPGSELAPLLAEDRADDLKGWLWGRDVVDVLRLLPEPLPAPEFVLLLRRLSPRLYSIASSPKAHPSEVHLCVGAIRYQSHGRSRHGVASTFLADRLAASDAARVFVQPAPSFKPPVSRDTPVVMVGPGTGVAPFRAFLEDRQAAGAKGKNWLFFGDQKRSTDFLYEEQLTGWVKDGHLNRLDLAFSRDQPEKIYVQDRMRENSNTLWAWLEEGAHFYVCGDAARMASDVDAALHKVIESSGGKTPEAARNYVGKMRSERRYQRDVY